MPVTLWSRTNPAGALAFNHFAHARVGLHNHIVPGAARGEIIQGRLGNGGDLVERVGGSMRCPETRPQARGGPRQGEKRKQDAEADEGE